MAAGQTDKLCLSFPVLFVSVPADRTPLRGVRGINKEYRHPCKFCLVLEKRCQFIECPFSKRFVYRLSNRFPRSDSLEIFKGNRPIRVFCGLNKIFGNAVVGVALEPAFTATDLLEMFLCVPSACLLEFRLQR